MLKKCVKLTFLITIQFICLPDLILATFTFKIIPSYTSFSHFFLCDKHRIFSSVKMATLKIDWGFFLVCFVSLEASMRWHAGHSSNHPAEYSPSETIGRYSWNQCWHSSTSGTITAHTQWMLKKNDESFPILVLYIICSLGKCRLFTKNCWKLLSCSPRPSCHYQQWSSNWNSGQFETAVDFCTLHEFMACGECTVWMVRTGLLGSDLKIVLTLESVRTCLRSYPWTGSWPSLNQVRFWSLFDHTVPRISISVLYIWLQLITRQLIHSTLWKIWTIVSRSSDLIAYYCCFY